MIHFAVGSTRLVVSHRTLDCTRGSTGHVHATKRRPEMLKMLTVLRAPITNVMLVHGTRYRRSHRATGRTRTR